MQQKIIFLRNAKNRNSAIVIVATIELGQFVLIKEFITINYYSSCIKLKKLLYINIYLNKYEVHKK